MVYTGTITSKRQLTIPAELFKRTNLSKGDKVLMEEKDGRIVLRPATSLVDELAGSLERYAIKGKSIDEIIKLESEAVGLAVVERHKRKLKREGSRLLAVKP